MSLESSGQPEVYQYASQTHSSFNASPFNYRQPPTPNYSPSASFEGGLMASPTISASTLTFHPNNYQLDTSSQRPPARSFAFEADRQGLARQALLRPQLKIGSHILQKEMVSRHGIAQYEDRFQDYLWEREYKYNLFSLVDEPWNRCVQGEGCGKMPGNQCIARNTTKKHWE